jgi:hypothetical protein
MGRRAPHRMGNGSGTLMAANSYSSTAIRPRLMFIEDQRRASCRVCPTILAAIISALAWPAAADLSVHPVEQALKPAEQASEAV